jgi:hypothetical protein
MQSYVYVQLYVSLVYGPKNKNFEEDKNVFDILFSRFVN